MGCVVMELICMHCTRCRAYTSPCLPVRLRPRFRACAELAACWDWASEPMLKRELKGAMGARGLKGGGGGCDRGAGAGAGTGTRAGVAGTTALPAPSQPNVRQRCKLVTGLRLCFSMLKQQQSTLCWLSACSVPMQERASRCCMADCFDRVCW